ncbi:O-acyltransferase like protein [Anopheles bellator]|uniref:O-acyltransferase like protein n=1 Tax=Anopheles bellator TaxID=139047 RepID=UPI00264A0952|nr:O-acyltransferase like protein [Anopheles bellator]
MTAFVSVRLRDRGLLRAVLVLLAVLHLTASQSPFPDRPIKIRSAEGGGGGGAQSAPSGGEPAYATVPLDTQSAIGDRRGDRRSAIDRNGPQDRTGDGERMAAGRHRSSPEGAADFGQQPELVLPRYEPSPPPGAGGAPPLGFQYPPDNVFRVPKRKAKKSYPEAAGAVGQRKSPSEGSNWTGPAGQLEASSSPGVVYAPPAGGQPNAFQLFTNLFDHGNWNILELRARVGERCAGHVALYLRDLRQQRAWALKASDSSGRYGSQYFFGNEFWMGSLTFCDEVNRVLRHTPMPPGARQLEMRFFVAKIAVQLGWLPTVQPSSILVGQCLPKSCTADDVTQLLRNDPLLQQLSNTGNSSTSNPSLSSSGLTVVHVRPVPGSYNLWSDPKVFALCTVVTVLATVMLYASCGTGRHGPPKGSTGTDRSGTNTKPGAWKLDVRRALERPEGKRAEAGAAGAGAGDALEMHKINLESNNNVANGGQPASRESAVPTAGANHYHHRKRPPTRFTADDILGCFDVGPNAASILSVEHASEDSLTCVHGLRLYSLLWTVLVHTYLQLFAVSENRFGRKIAERSFLYQVVGNASFSVDTFFFISGLLIVYLYLKSVSRSAAAAAAIAATGGPKVAGGGTGAATRKTCLSILYRYLRLTPVYWFTIVANEVILKWTYDRSVFTPGIIDHITCDRFWWRNILYVNNWFPFSEMCMIWSWYLANDMQFYVIAIVLLMISSRHFRTAAVLLLLCLGGSWLLSMYFSLHYRYTHKVADPFESFDILYDKPWQRIGPYIVGMITGYVLHRRPSPPRIVPPLRLLLWTLSTGTLIALIFGVWNGELSVLWTAWYVSVGHTAWGLALMWITLSCCWGYSNFVNGLLSYRGLFPLSRLAYCTYLIHPVVMMATSFQLESPMHLQHVLIITAFFGNAVISFLIAFGMSLMFEAPVIKLLKLFFQKPQ